MLDWVKNLFPAVTPADITPASSDASFRQYFRVRHEDTSHIVMDAPPDKEDCRPFIAVSNALCALGLQAPRVLEMDLEKGFLLLSDLGSRQYLPELHEANVESLYGDALDALARLQLGGDPATDLLPPYDAELLEREMELFREWFLGRHLELELTEAEHQVLDRTFACLRDSALEQPRVWVHRDYHSRNLMVTERDNPGILDFQDAVVGAVTYDLVSLLRDCYIAWPRERVESWALTYRGRLHAQGMSGVEDDRQFLRWFDLMGVQRHLKAIGIFARLNIRDGKPGYLRDIPRTLGYVLDVAGRYDELSDLGRLLRERDLPARLLS
ncbi:MAG: phosphotransferase [Candidatus Competibacteraceae bacterium]